MFFSPGMRVSPCRVACLPRSFSGSCASVVWLGSVTTVVSTSVVLLVVSVPCILNVLSPGDSITSAFHVDAVG